MTSAAPSLAPEAMLKGDSGLASTLPGGNLGGNRDNTSGGNFDRDPTSNVGSNVVIFEQTIDVDGDVADFFNSRFSTREDLVKIKPALQQQTEIGHNLNRKVHIARNHYESGMRLAIVAIGSSRLKPLN